MSFSIRAVGTKEEVLEKINKARTYPGGDPCFNATKMMLLDRVAELAPHRNIAPKDEVIGVQVCAEGHFSREFGGNVSIEIKLVTLSIPAPRLGECDAGPVNCVGPGTDSNAKTERKPEQRTPDVG